MGFEPVVIMVIIILIFLIVLSLFVLWIWMLIDCIRRTFETDNEKILWILVIILTQALGAIIYFFVIKIRDKQMNK